MENKSNDERPPIKREAPAAPGQRGTQSKASTASYAPTAATQAAPLRPRLLDERGIWLPQAVAKTVGVDGALVLQQLHFHITVTGGREHAGHLWWYSTYEQWQTDDFPFWKVSRLRRTFRDLEKRNLVVSCQIEGRSSRRKSYRIDYDQLRTLTRAHVHTRAASAQIERIEASKLSASFHNETDLHIRASKEARAAPARKRSGAASVFVPKYPHPESEEEMFNILDARGIDLDLNDIPLASEFFYSMRASGWIIPGTQRPVYDWIATLEARLDKIHGDYCD